MMTLSRFRNLQYFILFMTVVCVVVLYLHFSQHFSQQAMATTTPTTSPHYQDEDTHYPCGICDHSVGWDQCGVACESCGQWFHAGCQNISSKSYEHLGRSDVTWHCVICGTEPHPAQYNINIRLIPEHKLGQPIPPVPHIHPIKSKQTRQTCQTTTPFSLCELPVHCWQGRRI